MDGIPAADEKAGDDLGIALEAGLLELAAGVLPEDVPPRHAAGVGPSEEARRPNDIAVEPQRLAPRARQPPPGG